MRITRESPWESALQLVAERLQAAIESAGPGELVAVLFVKLPTEQAIADQVALEVIGNRGVAQEYISAEHVDREDLLQKARNHRPRSCPTCQSTGARRAISDSAGPRRPCQDSWHDREVQMEVDTTDLE